MRATIGCSITKILKKKGDCVSEISRGDVLLTIGEHVRSTCEVGKPLGTNANKVSQNKRVGPKSCLILELLSRSQTSVLTIC